MPYAVLWEVRGPHCETWRTNAELKCLHQPTSTQNIEDETIETAVYLKPTCEFSTKRWNEIKSYL